MSASCSEAWDDSTTELLSTINDKVCFWLILASNACFITSSKTVCACCQTLSLADEEEYLDEV